MTEPPTALPLRLLRLPRIQSWLRARPELLSSAVHAANFDVSHTFLCAWGCAAIGAGLVALAFPLAGLAVCAAAVVGGLASDTKAIVRRTETLEPSSMTLHDCMRVAHDFDAHDTVQFDDEGAARVIGGLVHAGLVVYSK